MSTDDYLVFCAGVRAFTGVDLGSYKRQQMERRIRSFVTSRTESASLEQFLDELRTSPAALDSFLDRMTINVSELFRNPDHWDELRRRLIALLPVSRPIRIWSAGCSYGAEAYTVACIVLEELPGADISIVGTDVDRRVLERARCGVFSDPDVRAVPAPTLARFFRRSETGWAAAAELKASCRFVSGDLLRDRYRTGWDLILCRNVVIYFTEATRMQVHESLAGALRPGGHLMVGATERVADSASIGLEPAWPFVYRKVG